MHVSWEGQKKPSQQACGCCAATPRSAASSKKPGAQAGWSAAPAAQCSLSGTFSLFSVSSMNCGGREEGREACVVAQRGG